jgi:hypothetical protein
MKSQLFALVAVASFAVVPASAQNPTADLEAPTPKPTTVAGCPAQSQAFHKCALAKAKTFKSPRTPDGRPDMQGFWRDRLTNGFSVEGMAKDDPLTRNLVQSATPGPGMIVDPPDGKIPYQPWAANFGRQGQNLKTYIDPHGRCSLHAPPRNVEVSPVYQLIQPPGGNYVLWLLEEVHEYRIIPTDGRPHIGKDIKLWGADSVGRWEGNTLVVDVTNFNGYPWLDDQGNFYSDAVHMVERWTMIDPDTMHYEVTIEDPKVYTRPWKMAWALERIKDAGFELIEEACREGDRDWVHLRSLGYQSYFGQTWKSR